MVKTMMDPIDRISTDRAPQPGGHYSQATAHGDLIFVSGQLPVPPGGLSGEPASFEAQVQQALANLLAIVRAAGGDADSVLKVTVYLAGVEHWPEFNRIYAEVFGVARPARSVVPVPALHHGFLVELEAVALRKRPVVSDP